MGLSFLTLAQYFFNMFTPSCVLHSYGENTVMLTFGIWFFFFLTAAESKEKVAQHMEELSKNSDVSFFSHN